HDRRQIPPPAGGGQWPSRRHRVDRRRGEVPARGNGARVERAEGIHPHRISRRQKTDDGGRMVLPIRLLSSDTRHYPGTGNLWRNRAVTSARACPATAFLPHSEPADQPALRWLVPRTRSSHHVAARAVANFGFKAALESLTC